MRNNFKRIAAVVLALIMSVSALVPAFAADADCPAVHTVDNCEYTVISEKAATCTEDGIATYACNACGTQFVAVTPKSGAHKYDESVIAATCTTAGTLTKVCSLCGDTKTETLKATGHVYEYEWKDDKDGKEDACVAGSVWTKRTCTVCGEVNTNGGTIADGHEWEVVELTKAPTCKTTGLATYACADCGKTLVNVAVSKTPDHNATVIAVVAPATCTTDRVERYNCTVCGVVEAPVEGTKGHGQHGWKTLTAAAKTCTTAEIPAGAKECADCGALCKADGTAYSADELKALAAACTNWYVNTTNANLQMTDENGWIITKNPTCTEAGSKYRTCANCGKVETKAIDATGHAKAAVPTIIPADCVNAGITYYVCNNGCEEKLDVVTEAALGHKMKTDKTWVDPTMPGDPDTDKVCGAAYYTTTFCETCGGNRTTVTSAYPAHNFVKNDVAATCSAYAYSINVCSACKAVYTNVEGTEGFDATKQKTDAAGHYDVGTVYDSANHRYTDLDGKYLASAITSIVAAPNCTTAGQYTVKCADCGENEHLVTVAALGHNYDELPEDYDITGLAITLKANTGTCLVQSVYEFTCKNGCSVKKTETPNDGTGKGHAKDYENGYTPEAAATCTKPGTTEGWTCANPWCSYTVVSKTSDTLHTIAAMNKTAEVLPTCTTGGNYEYYTCKLGADCELYDANTGLAYTVFANNNRVMNKDALAIAKLGHNVVNGIINGRDCDDFQYSTNVCDRCDEYIEVGNFDNAVGHQFDIKVSTIKDCVNGEYTTYKCVVCDAIETRKTGEAGHKDANGNIIATGCGSSDYNRKCEVCGLIVEKDAHTFGDWVIDGVYAKRMCSVCGSVEAIQHLTHAWDDGVEADGVITYTCFCGATKAEAVETEPAETEPDETKPAETDPVETDPVDEPKSGCGGSIAAIAVALVATLGTCVVFAGKKRD